MAPEESREDDVRGAARADDDAAVRWPVPRDDLRGEQSGAERGRVFEMCRRIVECSPWLKRQAKITADRISFPSIGGTIRAIPSDYASAAGSNQNLAIFDELWAFRASGPTSVGRAGAAADAQDRVSIDGDLCRFRG